MVLLKQNVPDHRIHVATINSLRLKPPYPPDLMVTSVSRFAENKWIYPKKQLPAGNKLRGVINFLRPVRINDGKTFSLDEDRHSQLILQLKEALCGLIFFRQVLTARKDIVKPLQIVGTADHLIILFANFAASGITSLDQIKPRRMRSIFENLTNSPLTHNQLLHLVRDLIVLSNNNLISNGLMKYKFEIEEKFIAPDLSENREIGALEQENIAFMLRISAIYIDKREEYAEMLSMHKRRKITSAQLRVWANANLPVSKPFRIQTISQRLSWFMRASCYCLIAYHLASRASEVFSAQRGFASTFKDKDIRKVLLELTIEKGTSHGEKRKYSVHPYLYFVADALHLLNDALGTQAKALFTHPSGGEMSVNEMVYWLRAFALAHGREILDMTTHSWRYALPELLVSSVKNPLQLIQYQLGHEFVTESIGYGFAGPAREELQEAALKAALSATENFISNVQSSETLGASQGLKIAAALKRGATMDDIKADIIEFGIVPLEIQPGIFCLKQVEAKGECGLRAGDTLPNSERCRGICKQQVQTHERYETAKKAIVELPKRLNATNTSTLEKLRIVTATNDDLVAWPSLREVLEKLLGENPQLGKWFK